MDDTSPEIRKMLKERYAKLTGEQRMLMGFASCQAAKSMVLASFPPDLSEKEKRIRLFLRYYSNDFTEEQKAKIIKHLESLNYDEPSAKESEEYTNELNDDWELGSEN